MLSMSIRSDLCGKKCAQKGGMLLTCGAEDQDEDESGNVKGGVV